MRVTKSVRVKLDWDTFTLPILTGTPVSAAGALANDANAVGIIMQQINEASLDEEFYIMTGGDVELSELDYEISTTAMQKIPGVKFYQSDLRPYQGGINEAVEAANAATEAANTATRRATTAVETAETAVTDASAAKEAAEDAEAVAQQAAAAAEAYAGSMQLIDHSDSDAPYSAKLVITDDGYPGIEVTATS